MSKKEKGKNENVKKESSVVTKESISATCAVFSFLALLILFTRTLIFGETGRVVHIFLTGAFGYLAYPLLFGALYLSVTSLIGKRFVKNRKLGVCVALTIIFAALVAHSIFTWSWSMDGYVKECFFSGEDFPKTAPGGLLGGVFVFALYAAFSRLGACIIFSLLTLFCGYLCYVMVNKNAERAPKAPKQPKQPKAPKQPKQKAPAQEAQPAPQAQPIQTYAIQEQNGENVPYAPFTPPMQSADRGQAVPQNIVDVRQKPGVRLNDGLLDEAATQGGYSPFGMPMTPPQPSEPMPMDSHAMLFGGSAADNYRKNLLFDPNSKVNQRPSVSPVQPTVESTYTPSYTNSYEDAVNGTSEQASQPTRVVNDRANDYSNPFEMRGGQETPTVLPWNTPVEPRKEESPFLDVPEARETHNPVGFVEEAESRAPVIEPPVVEETPAQSTYQRHEYMNLFSPENPNVFGNDEESARFGREFADRAVPREERTFLEEDTREERGGRDGLHLLDEEEDNPYSLRSDFDTPPVEEERPRARELPELGRRGFEEERTETRGRGFEEESRETRGRGMVEEPPKPVEPPKPAEPPKPRIIRPYVRPRLDDFDCRDIQPTANEEEIRQTKENIIATLEEFKITGASIASVTFGPTVTRYNVTIPRSISPKKVVALNESIAISLLSSGVNIYPNYEDGVVSIEVPNKERQFVQLGCMLTGDTFVNAKSSALMFAMGKDVANRKVYGDICKMVHLLVAGSTKSGKSVFLGALIISLIYKYSPEELRLILIDPKKTEFVLYNNLPHLMINEIITDVKKAVQSLNWACAEMERRYTLFEQMSRSGKYVVNLDQYNEQLDKNDRLPKIVIIIDELADLMLEAKKEMEDRIQSLTQKARAAGIHLIVATQRPSTDVITGVIKSNLTTRIAFAVASEVDSRVILDQTGAHKLLGMGDLLYTMPGINQPVRVQSAFIAPEESQRIVNFIKSNNEAYYDEEATAYINSRGGNGGGNEMGGNGTVDPVCIDALRLVIQSNSASISMIQRKFTTGYNRAGKIIEWMEDMGYISSFDGSKSRKVLITKEEFESKYGPL